MIRGILIDLSGVLYVGDAPIPGAREALARLHEAGLPVRFVTNTTRTPNQALRAKLLDMGFEIPEEAIFTPAAAARNELSRQRLTPHLLIHPALAEDFTDTQIADAQGTAVVVGDAGDGFTYQALNAAFRKLVDGAAFFALAKNRTFRDADGGLSLDAGAFVAALEYASGQQVTVLGKPSSAFFSAAARSMTLPLQDLVMIGDDAENDVSGALKAGVGRALLVRTGKYRPNAEKTVDPQPTAVVDDLAAAVDWISKQN